MMLMATIAAAAGACGAWYAACQSYRVANASELRQATLSYITAYNELRKTTGNALGSVEGYNKSEDHQVQIQIVSGLLVMVIDTMYRAGDERAPKWAGFIKEIPGPLLDCDFRLEWYATEHETKTAIENARLHVKNQQKKNKN